MSQSAEFWVVITGQLSKRLQNLERTVSEIRRDLCELRATVDALRRQGSGSRS